jgi:Mn-dependent DtxR family transcriptional regulator
MANLVKPSEQELLEIVEKHRGCQAYVYANWLFKYKVSTSWVRNALIKLEKRGLVTSTRNRGIKYDDTGHFIYWDIAK